MQGGLGVATPLHSHIEEIPKQRLPDFWKKNHVQMAAIMHAGIRSSGSLNACMGMRLMKHVIYTNPRVVHHGNYM